MFATKLLLVELSSVLTKTLWVLSVLVLTPETPANAVTVAVSEQTVYAVDNDGALKALNISNPSQSAAVKLVANSLPIYATLSQASLTLTGNSTSSVFAVEFSAISSASSVQLATVFTGIAAVLSTLL